MVSGVSYTESRFCDHAPGVAFFVFKFGVIGLRMHESSLVHALSEVSSVSPSGGAML